MSQQKHLTVGEVAKIFDTPAWRIRRVVDELDPEVGLAADNSSCCPQDERTHKRPRRRWTSARPSKATAPFQATNYAAEWWQLQQFPTPSMILQLDHL